MFISDYYESLDNFCFRHFLAMAAVAVGAGAVMMSAASPSCCNVYLLHLHHASPPMSCHSSVDIIRGPASSDSQRVELWGIVLQ
jgi:hypothetical protein